jgi:hypothetical protein
MISYKGLFQQTLWRQSGKIWIWNISVKLRTMNNGTLRRLLVTASVVPSSPILVTLMKEALSSPKCRFLQEPHDVTTQKTPFFIVTDVKTSTLTKSRTFRTCSSIRCTTTSFNINKLERTVLIATICDYLIHSFNRLVVFLQFPLPSNFLFVFAYVRILHRRCCLRSHLFKDGQIYWRSKPLTIISRDQELHTLIG